MFILPVEGFRATRYFPGNEIMDKVEERADELLRVLFARDYMYESSIQPHSGTQANTVVFNAVLNPGDIVLSLRPQDGGHVSHHLIAGRRNPVTFYRLSQDETIDYAALEETALRVRPKLIIAGGSACPREIDFQRIGAVAKRCDALLHADVSHTATFIAAGLHAPVAPYADFITFNMVKNMRGPNGGVLIYRSKFRQRVQRALFPGTQGGANENTMFAKLVALEALLEMDLPRYASRMVHNARIMANVLEERGLHVVTGGTDTHMVLVDIRARPCTGRDIERKCEGYGVFLNRNLVPGDARPARIASGIRLGTSGISVLGYSDADVMRLAHWVADRICGVADNARTLIDDLTTRYDADHCVFG